MKRLHCQFQADVMVILYYFLVCSHLTFALLAWGRYGPTIVAEIECAHWRASNLLTDYNLNILTFHSIMTSFALKERKYFFLFKLKTFDITMSTYIS